MPASDYDALIVGARVAGSTLAIRLAQRGRRVLMVDRDSFPSDTISTHGLNFMAVDSLRRLGVLERIEAAGFRRMYRHRAWLGDIMVEAPAGPPGAYTLAPRRIVLDQVLIDRAVEAGAEFMERSRVDGLLVEDGTIVGATIQRIGGDAFEVRSRVVVGADGKSSKIAEWVGAAKYSEGDPGRPIFYGYFQGVESLTEPTVEMFFASNHLGFCMPMRPDEHILIIEAQPEDFARIRTDARAWFLSEYTTFPGMNTRIRHATLEGNILGVRGIQNYFRTPYGPGWALSGDAAYVKDPITAYGVGDAMLQGFWLARSLDEFFGGKPWQEAMSAYQERRDNAFRAFFEQTAHAVSLRDDEGALAELRSVLVNQHDTRVLLQMMPRFLDQAFDPMARFRHAIMRSAWDTAQEQSSTPAAT
ncbi:MAG TPA: NAD(P)/FAD-dependent oxidoreductase [Candidatus Dormibacteraeota bacterium]|nr:NAD(P)/FAD-dependent oxidoreductase [Candidatus Dormibacteraeota bacterium]